MVNMLYGYARDSTDAQDITNQVAQLKAAGCETVFREKMSGTTSDRPQLKKLIAQLTNGDVLIIPAVDRLSRDTADLLVIARSLQKAGAGLRSLVRTCGRHNVRFRRSRSFHAWYFRKTGAPPDS